MEVVIPCSHVGSLTSGGRCTEPILAYFRLTCCRSKQVSETNNAQPVEANSLGCVCATKYARSTVPNMLRPQHFAGIVAARRPLLARATWKRPRHGNPKCRSSFARCTLSQDLSMGDASESTGIPQRVLVLGKVWPERSSSAAGVRTGDLVQAFQRWGAKVSFVCAARVNEHSSMLHDTGVCIYSIPLNRETAFRRVLQEVKPDLCVFDRFTLEEMFGFMVRKHCPEALRVLDTQDLHSLRDAREMAFKRTHDLKVACAAVPGAESTMLLRELAAILRSDLSLVVSDMEQDLLINTFHVPTAKVALSRWYYAPPSPLEELPQFQERAHFVTIGNFRHSPNMDSVAWLAEEVWPLIAEHLPEAEMHVYGAYPSKRAMQMHSPTRRFHVLGQARHLTMLESYRVLLAPLRYGAGVKGKIVDAWWHGLPVVTTPIGSEGMQHAARGGDARWGGCGSALDAISIVEQAVDLYENRGRWEAAQRNGREICLQLFDRATNEAALMQDVQAAMLRKATQLNQDNMSVQDAMLQHHSFRGNEYFSRWIQLKEQAHQLDAIEEAHSDQAAGLESNQAESPNTETRRIKNVIGRAVRDNSKDLKRKISAVAQSETSAQLIKDNMHTLLQTALPNAEPAVVDSLVHYAKHHSSVAGFFETGLIPLYAEIHRYQMDNGIHGSVGEIGVYRGKSFIPLYMLLASCESSHQRKEVALAIDCFDQQQYNQDNSGEGDQDEFIRNVKRFKPHLDPGLDLFKVIKADSTSLTAQDLKIAANGGSFRLFSIDGAHTAAATLTDLTTAAGCLNPNGGVLILDDVFNSDWPGVSEGFYTFMNQLNEGHQMIPLAIAYNKIFLIHCDFHQAALEHLQRYLPEKKTSTLWGREVVIYEAGWIAAFYANDRL